MIGNSGLGGNFPQINRGMQVGGAKSLFHSMREQALILDKVFKAGYGVLRAGTLMGVCTGATNSADYGKLVPYAMLNAAAAVNGGNAKAYLTADFASGGATTCQITNEDSYKFTLGDHLVMGATGQTSVSTGAEITGISRSTSNGIATLTFTSITSAVMTVASNAYVHVKQSDASAPFSKAVYVLDADTDTGVGVDAKGAIASVVVSNAILYAAIINNINGESAAYTDLGAVSDDRYIILK